MHKIQNVILFIKYTKNKLFLKKKNILLILWLWLKFENVEFGLFQAVALP